MEVDWDRVIDLLLTGVVQALVILLGAWCAIQLERRARYRRDVEEAVLRLNAAFGHIFGPLVKYSYKNDTKAFIGVGHVSDHFADIHKILGEIRVKSMGYPRKRRRELVQEVARLQNGFLLIPGIVLAKKELPRDGVASLSVRRMNQLVFGDQDPPPDPTDLDRWLDLLGVRTEKPRQ